MTPTEIITAARNQYNSVGSSFYSDSELYQLIYAAEMDLCRRAFVLEAINSSTSTVNGTQGYSLPTYAFAVKKITWDGITLRKIDFKEDDILSGNDEDTTQTGDPRYYYIWNRTIYLRPVPSSAKTLKIWSYNIPAAVTSVSTLDVDTQYHPDIVWYLLGHMVAKDEDLNTSQFYFSLWEKAVENAKKDVRNRKKSDSFSYVKDEEVLMDTTLIGVI